MIISFDDGGNRPRWGIGPRWQMWLARLLGKRREATDGAGHFIGYEWRGIIHVWRIDH